MWRTVMGMLPVACWRAQMDQVTLARAATQDLLQPPTTTHHGFSAEVTVNASHLVLVHLVQFGMDLQTEHKCRGGGVHDRVPG